MINEEKVNEEIKELEGEIAEQKEELDQIQEGVENTSVTDTGVTDTSVTDTSVTDTSDKEEENVDTQDAQDKEEVQESLSSRNFRILAKQKQEEARKRKEYEKELEEQKKKNEELLAQLKKYKEDNFEDYNEEDYKSKKTKKTKEKDIESIITNEIDRRTAESELIKEYPDFEKVVNDINVSILQDLDPASIKAIGNASSWKEVGEITYKAIKRNKIYIDTSGNKERIEKNMSKPKPAASLKTGKKMKTDPFAYLNTAEGQAELRRELNESMRKL